MKGLLQLTNSDQLSQCPNYKEKLLENGTLLGVTCKTQNIYHTTFTSVLILHINEWKYIVCILSPCLFNLYAEYTMRNAGLDEAQARIKIASRNINNLRYADDTMLMAEREKELKSLLIESERGE